LKTVDEIKAEAIGYWNWFVNGLAERWAETYRRQLKRRGYHLTEKLIAIQGIGSESYPSVRNICNFNSLKLVPAPAPFGEYFDSQEDSLYHDKELNRTDEIFQLLLGKDAIDYEKLFREGDYFFLIRKARKRIIEIHSKQRQKIPPMILLLKKHKKELMKHRPEECEKEYQEGIDVLENMQRFSGALVDYLKNEWPKEFGFYASMDDKPRKPEYWQRQPCWNEVLPRLFEQIKEIFNPPLQTEKEIHLRMAGILQIVYPSVWIGDRQILAANIKTRLASIRKKSL
jgi:hypothetical protein